MLDICLNGHSTVKEAKMLDSDECPVCEGTGNDPEPCGCTCIAEGRPTGILALCDRSCCSNCQGAGCGGSCPFCGGSGRKSDWVEGNPSYQDLSIRT